MSDGTLFLLQETTDDEKQDEDSRPITPMTPKSGSLSHEPQSVRRLQSRNAMSQKFLSNVSKARGSHESPYATRSWEVMCKDEEKVRCGSRLRTLHS